MKKILQFSLVSMLFFVCTSSVYARCCSDGGHPCYPLCLVETEQGLVEIDKVKFSSDDLNALTETKCHLMSPRTGDIKCCVYEDGKEKYCYIK